MKPAWGWLRARLNRRTLIWGGLLAALAIGLNFVPLFNVLGFDYALVLGLIAGPAATDIGHHIGATTRLNAAAKSLSPSALAWQLTVRSWGRALAVLLIPLAASLVTALWVRNCNLGAGFAFFVLLPVSTALFAAPLGALVGFSVRRWSRVMAVGLPVVSLLWTLHRLYFDPPVFALDPFGGFFPGPIYDEAMRPPPRLFWYRMANLLWLGTALAIFTAVRASALRGFRRALAPLGLAAAALITSVSVYAQRSDFGFHVTGAHLRTILRRATTTPDFRVFSDPANDGTAEERALFLRDLEFRHAQLTKTLGVKPPGPITVYLFPSPQLKKDLVGAGGTLYAKPWTREIFLQADRFPMGSLRHELAHVFAGAFGDPVFGIAMKWRLPVPRLSGGLIEGIAEAADYGDPNGRATVHQEARAMIEAGLAPPLAKVVGAGFSTLSGPRAYTIAGSFTHYLLATFGADKLRAVFQSGGDFQGIYGHSLAALESDWRAFVTQQPLDEQDKARAKERYRRPAIFQKVCARDIAARIETARGHLYSLPEEAAAIFASVCADDPHEPSHRLNLADAHAAAGDVSAALAVTNAIEGDQELTTPLRARAANLASSVHFHAGDFSQARAATERAGALATEESEQRQAFARLRALADPAAQRTIGRLFFGDGPTRGVDPALGLFLVDRFASANPTEALGPYLLGRQLLSRDPALALAPLARACPFAGEGTDLPVALPTTFRTECHRMRGEAGFRTGDFRTSRAAWERLRADAPTEADRLRAGDFLERIAWEEQHPIARPQPGRR
ncbi:MAG TPA: hypothetical protein VGG33_23155 [Polyangia bacterium]